MLLRVKRHCNTRFCTQFFWGTPGVHKKLKFSEYYLFFHIYSSPWLLLLPLSSLDL